MGVSMRINQAGIQLIKDFEGLRLKPYLDVVGIATIGIGVTTYEDGRKVSIKDPSITEERAIELLQHHIQLYEKQVSTVVKTALNENEFAALVSLCYNIGPGAFAKSTLVKLLNLNKKADAALEFLKWNKAGGKEVKGLTRRREAEKALFLTPVAVAPIKSVLPEGPTEDEVAKKLQEIEDKILHKK
jgi:lysozyme